MYFLFKVEVNKYLLGAGIFVFETRLGCLDKEGNPRAEELINAAVTMFDRTEQLMVRPLWISKLFTPQIYKDFLEASRTLFTHGNIHCLSEVHSKLCALNVRFKTNARWIIINGTII